MAERDPRIDAFVASLEKRVTDRAAMAALRRQAGKPPGTAMEAHRYVAWATQGDRPSWRDDTLYILAGLFALWHQGKDKVETNGVARNLGGSLRKLARDEKGTVTEDRLESVGRRFAALLNSHRDELYIHLRHAVSLLKNKAVPVDWRRLLADLRGWNWPSRSVQRAWAREFWKEEKQ